MSGVRVSVGARASGCRLDCWARAGAADPTTSAPARRHLLLPATAVPPRPPAGPRKRRRNPSDCGPGPAARAAALAPMSPLAPAAAARRSHSDLAYRAVPPEDLVHLLRADVERQVAHVQDPAGPRRPGAERWGAGVVGRAVCCVLLRRVGACARAGARRGASSCARHEWLVAAAGSSRERGEAERTCARSAVRGGRRAAPPAPRTCSLRAAGASTCALLPPPWLPLCLSLRPLWPRSRDGQITSGQQGAPVSGPQYREIITRYVLLLRAPRGAAAGVER